VESRWHLVRRSVPRGSGLERQDVDIASSDILTRGSLTIGIRDSKFDCTRSLLQVSQYCKAQFPKATAERSTERPVGDEKF
jgi:hypothetical protein